MIDDSVPHALSAVLLVALFGGPSLALLATAVGNGAARWPWPRGLVVVFALGMAMAGTTAIALGACGIFSLAGETAAMSALTAAILALGRSRMAWPFSRASATEVAGFVLVAALAAATLLGRPFEMLLGERDATVYTVSGIGLARQGSIVLRDHTADRIGPEAMRRFYPGPREENHRPSWTYLPQFVKYLGFYYVDADRRTIIAQGLPLLPALIAIFYSVFGLGGAFATNNFVGVLAVLSVFAAGIPLVGELAATLGASLLALDLVEVWAARYPVAEILFQMLLFAGLAAHLRGDRFSRAMAGFLLGATLFAKIEAALILAPLGVYGAVAVARGRRVPGGVFWASFAVTAAAAAACCAWFQADYALKAYATFARWETRVAQRYFVSAGSVFVTCFAVITVLATLGLALHSSAGRQSMARHVGRGFAIGVVLFGAFGYWIRPHLTGFVAGQGKTLVWLTWYVSPAVLLVAIAGLAHYAWTRANAENLFVLAMLFTLSAVFLHFTFVNLLHIYLTRRFVPATLPLVLLFCAYGVTVIGSWGTGWSRWLAAATAAAMAVGSVHAIVTRSRHLYGHREYPGLARHFSDLAESLRTEDVVFLSDGKVRDLLGPALEFVFGVKTLVVWAPTYQREKSLIREWIAQGTAIGALTIDKPLEDVQGTEEFEALDHPVWWLRALGEVEDKFPSDVWQDSVTLSRYSAGPGSDPLYEFWKREGPRVTRKICDGQVRLLGGNRFLVRHMLRDCQRSGVPERSVGYLVGEAESETWQKTLEVYGARFVRRDLEGVVLFDEVSPRSDPWATRLSPSGWNVQASHGREWANLALDGRLDTRWGSHAPQQSGMSFTIGFPEPMDIAWVKIRMGNYATDRARAFAFATSTDGQHWNRQEVPTVVAGIRWRDRLPEENAEGDVDLWVNARGLRGFRLLNFGESSHFDWSIAELEIDGRPSANQP